MPKPELIAFANALQPIIMLKYYSKLNTLITMEDIENIIATPEFEKKYESYYQQMTQIINSDTETGSIVSRSQSQYTTEAPNPQIQVSSDEIIPDGSLLMKIITETSKIDENGSETVVINLGNNIDNIDPKNKIDIRNTVLSHLKHKKSRLAINRADLNSGNDIDNEIPTLDKKISNLENCIKWLQRTTRKRGAFGRKAANDFDENKMISRFIKYNVKVTSNKESESIAFNPAQSNAEKKRFLNAVRARIPGLFRPKNFDKRVDDFISSNAGEGLTKEDFLKLVDECASYFNKKQLDERIVLTVQQTAENQVYRTDISSLLVSVADYMESNRDSCCYFENIWNNKHQNKIIKNVRLLAKKIGNKAGTMIPVDGVIELGTQFGIPITISHGSTNSVPSNNQPPPTGYDPLSDNRIGEPAFQANPLYETDDDNYEYDPSDPSGY